MVRPLYCNSILAQTSKRLFGGLQLAKSTSLVATRYECVLDVLTWYCCCARFAPLTNGDADFSTDQIDPHRMIYFLLKYIFGANHFLMFTLWYSTRIIYDLPDLDHAHQVGSVLRKACGHICWVGPVDSGYGSCA